MKYRKDVTDQEVEAAYRQVFEAEIKGFLVPRVNISDTDGPPEPAPRGTKQPRKEAKAGRPDVIPNDDERLLLESVFEKPNLPITNRAASLGLSSYSMNKTKGSIISKGLAQQFTINLGKDFGGNITLLSLTENGLKAIGKKQGSAKLQNESHEHWWWKSQIFRHYKNKGIPAVIEKSMNGKHADIGIRHKGRDIAIEVELSPKNALTNIIQDLNAGFDLVLSCAKNRMVEKQITERFRALPEYGRLMDKVTFRLLSAFEFVKEIKKP